MVKIIAGYDTEWEHLSERHENLDKQINALLKEYSDAPNGDLIWSYVVIGTFGAGKTQLLYYIFKRSIENGLLPIYFLAEDLFREIINKKEDETWLPGSLNTLVNDKAQQVYSSLISNDNKALTKVLNPGNENTREMVQELVNHFSSHESLPKTVLLLDELEQQYGNLQEKIEAKDRSPLRDWLESRDYLKFIALAPAGIYEMGGADQTRVERIVIPPADVTYIRSKYLPDSVGKANSCWWLSRGKPRHLFKAYKKLKELDVNSLEVPTLFLIVRDELDSIGQEPSRVPPAVLENIPADKSRHILNLVPIAGEKKRRYIIDTGKLDTGKFAEKLREAFEIKSEEAALVGGYFKMVVKALSDESNLLYLDMNELPELLALSLDLFLEYEHASPHIKDRLRELMALYENLGEPIVHVSLSKLWDAQETDRELPFTIRQIREMFPFPIMNPMVRNYVPKDIERRLEGKGLPVWKWKEGDIQVLFFASWRDLETYSVTDEFYSLALPDGKGVLCILPPDLGELDRTTKLEWLEKNGKLKIITAAPLIADFLLSAAGDIGDEIPAELTETLDRFQSEKDDIILSRKAIIYAEAVSDLAKGNLPRPTYFCKEPPPYADSVWGKSQIASPSIAVSGCALAYGAMNPTEKGFLAHLQAIFKGGREGRGEGPLHTFIVKPRIGLPSLVDDLLPRFGTRKELRDAPIITGLSGYLSTSYQQLADLARLIELREFLKLGNEEDKLRLLEAFWRGVRGDFDQDGLDILIDRIENDYLKTAIEATELEQEAIAYFELEGIDFEDAESIVHAKDDFENLVRCAKDTIQDKGGGGSLVRNLYKMIVNQLVENIEGELRSLKPNLTSIKTVINDMKTVSEDLQRNFWEYEKAAQFAEINKDDIDGFVSQEIKIGGRLSLEELEDEIRNRTSNLEETSESFSSLQRTLAVLETNISPPKEV